MMTDQPCIELTNQLWLVKSTPGILSISQLTTPQSASTSQPNTWVATTCGIDQTSIIATVMAMRTQKFTRRISSAISSPMRTDRTTQMAATATVRQTTVQKNGVFSTP